MESKADSRVLMKDIKIIFHLCIFIFVLNYLSKYDVTLEESWELIFLWNSILEEKEKAVWLNKSEKFMNQLGPFL